MADHFLAALGCARRALGRPGDPASDAHLLDRFVRDGDGAAFAELVARHGPVVWAACRRGAATAADAEDAFQATFLVLARRAGRVRRAAAVSGWLFRVAVRLAARTRARIAFPAGPGRPVADPAPDPADRAAWQDLVAVLDVELAALPDAVRAALVCCYYEGLTQDEAARRLGWKVRTVRARVGRGRTILRRRLARRGVDLGATLAAASVGLDAPAVVPQWSPTAAAGAATSPAVSDLVGHGLALTTGAVSLRLGVGAVVVALAAGVGYALVAGPGRVPAGHNGGPPLAVSPSVPPADPRAPVDVAAVYSRAVDGCVYIVRQTDGGPIEGTGALIDKENRLVLTTYRVVGDSDVVSVQFPYHKPDGTVETDRKDYARSAAAKLTPMGRVIHRDKARDLALVQLDRLGRQARPLELAETGVRETVLHIGSGTGPLFAMTVRNVLPADPLAMPAPVEPVPAQRIALSGTTDDSGGPLVGRDARLVGVVTAAGTGPADRPVTLAIGIAEVRAFLADKDKEVATPPPAPIVKASDPPANPIPDDVPRPVDPISTDLDVEALYKKVVKSSVFIVTPVKGGFGMGSGSLIDAEKRYVLTNKHVVHDEDTVFVQFPVFLKDGSIMTDKQEYIKRIPTGQAIKGKVLHRDQTRDLALVQLEKVPSGTPALPLAKKRGVGVGAPVWHIGNVAGAQQVFGITEGKVRAVGVEKFPVAGGTQDSQFMVRARVVTVSNPLHAGDASGPLVDRRGFQVAVAASAPVSPGTLGRGIDVTEVWAFLSEKKVKVPAAEPDAVEPPEKRDRGPDLRPPLDPDRGMPIPERPRGDSGPSAADDRAAADKLRLAKLFAEGEENRPVFQAKLREIVARYPGTAAAKEAQKLLDGPR